jgi:hypothetical protein
MAVTTDLGIPGEKLIPESLQAGRRLALLVDETAVEEEEIDESYSVTTSVKSTIFPGGDGGSGGSGGSGDGGGSRGGEGGGGDQA